ncbi:MAG TPA: TIGR03118 family protein, partial [Steroidobacteraceae bacterium]|nr:TIGR03118 family protein [Steroidobacteraceae bacterium]
AYAQRLPSSGADAVTGAGRGLIAVFTPSGDFITRLIGAGGALDAPWAMVRAPADGEFPFAGALLVGNTGDGTIRAFDVRTGALLGSLADEKGAVLAIPNLHGLAFGNGYPNQPRTTLFFTAGAHAAAQGWYGRLDAALPAE